MTIQFDEGAGKRQSAMWSWRAITAPRRPLELASCALAGAALVVGVAIAGNYVGRTTLATASLEGSWGDVPSPASTIARKASFMTPGEVDVRAIARPQLANITQTVTSAAKGDFLVDDPIADEEERTTVSDKLKVTPAVWKMEQSWAIGAERKQRILAQRRKRKAEESCLARAVYFEARSESEMGQLAVAEVILNRVHSRQYPNSICGVVYQGADRKKSCQFSFACDGKTDQPRSAKAWRHSLKIARRALSGENSIKVISTATHYHADYVRPKWSGAMQRIIKIGRHIFYRDS